MHAPSFSWSSACWSASAFCLTVRFFMPVFGHNFKFFDAKTKKFLSNGVNLQMNLEKNYVGAWSVRACR